MAGGDRFATPGKTAVDRQNYRAAQNVLNWFLTKPPPAGTYSGLRTGPQMSHEFESTSILPIDGSNALLRSLSPFVIQVEPPLVFGSDPAFMDGTQDKNSPNIGIYRAATKGNNGFMESRQKLANSAFATADFNQASIEEIITGGDGTQRTAKPGSSDGQTLSHLEEGGSNAFGKPAIADLQVAIDIAMQLQGILETPPLVLLINPESIDIQRQRVQQYSDRSRFGYIFHAWGEDQAKLSITARCGAFISGGRGVQYASKKESASWQNLMSAFQFYRNNGYIHDTVGQSYANHFVGALSIQYDQWTYYGNMQSFNWTHDASNELGGVTFTMEFVANMIVDGATQPFTVMPLKSPNPGAGPGASAGRGSDFFDPVVPGPRPRGVQNFATDDMLALAATGSAQPAPAPTLKVGTQGFQPDQELTFTVAETGQGQNDEVTFTVAETGQAPPPEPFRI